MVWISNPKVLCIAYTIFRSWLKSFYFIVSIVNLITRSHKRNVWDSLKNSIYDLRIIYQYFLITFWHRSQISRILKDIFFMMFTKLKTMEKSAILGTFIAIYEDKIFGIRSTISTELQRYTVYKKMFLFLIDRQNIWNSNLRRTYSPISKNMFYLVITI